MRLLVLNAGKFASVEGGTVRFKNLVVNLGQDKVVWADTVTSRDYYKTEDLDNRVPKNVTVIPGKKVAKNPALEWYAREKHFLAAAKDAFAKGRIDACVFYNAWGTLMARRFLRSKGVPVVFDYIDLMSAFRDNAIERVFARAATEEALSSSDLVICTAQRLVEHARSHNNNVVLIPNGVDFARFSKAKPLKLKHPNVGFVGGFGNWTDFDKLLHAARAHPNVTFYIIGDGMERPKLVAASKLLPNVVVSDGFVPHETAARYMSGFDACVIPFKVNELTDAVCPIKLFEYWSLGKPVIVSPTYEVQRIVQNDEALFASDAVEWSQKIGSVLQSKALARELGQKGKRLAREYDWPALGKRFRHALSTVVPKRHSHHSKK